MTVFPQSLSAEGEVRWGDFCNALQKAGLPQQPFDAVELELKHLFACSDFLAQSCIRNPAILHDLIQSGDLVHPYSRDVYQKAVSKSVESAESQESLSRDFRGLRQREMVRIAFRDLSGRADLLETMSDLSDFAEACIDGAIAALCRWGRERWGTPVGPDGKEQQMVVIGLGKLGARELNFSSDVDLMFAFPEYGHTAGGAERISNEEFFVRICREFLKIFTESSTEGILFRVDLRLRPYGENGPLVMNFNSMEVYYEAQGREWERYMLVKARVVGGDRQSGREMLRRLNPFVYRRYLDYGTFESLREMKRSISLEVMRKGLEDNIKLGSGGIREIEFFGQVFQLLRGGVEPELQEPSILKVLPLLVQGGYIDLRTCDELREAYVFLRNTEHRLQEFSDRQTHQLPTDPTQKRCLAIAMGAASWSDFAGILAEHRNRVHGHFNQILAAEEKGDAGSRERDSLRAVWLNLLGKPEEEQAILSAGYADPGEVVGLLNYLRDDSATRSLSAVGRDKLDRLMPILIQKAGQSENPALVLRRLVDLIRAVERRTCYIALLLENPGVVEHLVSLSNNSQWITGFLSRHPVLLDELLDSRTFAEPPSREQMAADLTRRLERVAAGDLEEQIEQMCIFKQANTLRVAVADLSAAYPLMRVSDHLSHIAEIVLEKIISFSYAYLMEKYGRPSHTRGQDGSMGFAVIAYGKLGGIELGYGSDLDLVFLHNAEQGRTEGGQSSPIENAQFFARMGQRIVHTLTTHTRAGRLYEIDMRLRPSGSAGPIVSQVDAFGEYQTKDAWTWEHQALVRARPICGDPVVIDRFRSIREAVLRKRRLGEKLLQEIRTMREKMREGRRPVAADQFHLKEGHGGIIDIEFLVQYLVLLHACQHRELVEWSDNVRQLEALSKAGILDVHDSDALKGAYLKFRGEVHRLNLQEKIPVVPLGKFEARRKKVAEIWERFLGA